MLTHGFVLKIMKSDNFLHAHYKKVKLRNKLKIDDANDYQCYCEACSDWSSSNILCLKSVPSYSSLVYSILVSLVQLVFGPTWRC